MQDIFLGGILAFGIVVAWRIGTIAATAVVVGFGAWAVAINTSDGHTLDPTRIAIGAFVVLGVTAIGYVWATRNKQPKRRVDTFDGRSIRQHTRNDDGFGSVHFTPLFLHKSADNSCSSSSSDSSLCSGSDGGGGGGD